MLDYKVTAKRDNYRGGDERKRKKALEFNRIADRVEQHLQGIYDQIVPGSPPQAIFSHTVAHILNENTAIVTRIISSIDGGSGGVTFWKPDAQGRYNQ